MITPTDINDKNKPNREPYIIHGSKENTVKHMNELLKEAEEYRKHLKTNSKSK